MLCLGSKLSFAGLDGCTIVGDRPAASRLRLVVALAIIVFGVLGTCCFPVNGFASQISQTESMVAVTPVKGGANSRSSTEVPADYGTSPSNIANGGYVAHAHGKTYFVTSGYCIGCSEDGSSNAKVLYQNLGQEDAWGYKTQNGFPISCLHVTNDSLVFVERQNDGSSQYYYDIVRTKLDGTGREVIAKKLKPSGYGTQQWSLRAYMWLDGGNMYFSDGDGIWRQPLDGSNRKRVADVESYGVYAIADGVVYCTADGGKKVIATDADSGASTTIFDSSKVMDTKSGSSGTSGSDGLYVVAIVPDGSRMYCGYTVGASRASDAMDGCMSVSCGGGDVRYDYSGANNGKDRATGLVSLAADNGRLFAIFGSHRQGTQLVEMGNDRDGLRSLYEPSDNGKDGDETIGDWAQIANGRIYFESGKASQSVGFTGDGTLKTGDTCSTPSSIRLDGSGL